MSTLAWIGVSGLPFGYLSSLWSWMDSMGRSGNEGRGFPPVYFVAMSSTLQDLLSGYNDWIELSTSVVILGIIGEIIIDVWFDWKDGASRLRISLSAALGFVVALGVGGELWYGRQVASVSAQIQQQADADVADAKIKVEEARQAALQVLPLAKVRVLASEENAEFGNSRYFEPLRAFAGINAIVEDSGEDDAPRAAREIRGLLKKVGWKIVKPVPHKADFEFDAGVTVQWYQVNPHEFKLTSSTAPCGYCKAKAEEERLEHAGYALVEVLNANDWPGVQINLPFNFGPITAQTIPRNTVRVLVGPKPGAWLLNPLVQKWMKEAQDAAEEAGRAKAKGASTP